jgi:chromate transporter
MTSAAAEVVPLRTIAINWTRIGITGFGGPPTHIALLRRLVVERERWVDQRESEDALAACNLLPGPASTHLAIFLARRVAGPWGAVVGGLGFIVPAVVLIIVLSVVFLGESPPLVAALIAFLPSFAFVLIGGDRFEGIRTNPRAQAFLAGAGPAAIGAIFGAAIPLTAALRETWEFVVLGVAAVALLLARRSIVSTLVGARRWSAWCWRWPARRCRGKEVE